MKRIIIPVLIALMLVTLCACAKKEEPEAFVSMANPWSDAASAEEAAQGAQVEHFSVPDDETELNAGPVNWSAFRYMKGIAEADGWAGTAELTVRKGIAEDYEDVSGDYTEYPYSWTQDAYGATVSCFGSQKGRAMKAVWISGSFSYSIMLRGSGGNSDAVGLDEQDLALLVSGIH